MELAGVARLVLRPGLLDGQLGVTQAAAQANPTHELVSYGLVATLSVGGHGGGVALLGRLPPQHLEHPLRDAVPARQGGRLPAHGRLVALQAHFTWEMNMIECLIAFKLNVGLICFTRLLFVRSHANRRSLGVMKNVYAHILR